MLTIHIGTNPNGGWAVRVVEWDHEIFGYLLRRTTCTSLNLVALERVLKDVEGGQVVNLYTACYPFYKGMTDLHYWRNKDFKSSGRALKHRDQWRKVDAMIGDLTIRPQVVENARPDDVRVRLLAAWAIEHKPLGCAP